MFSAQIEKWKIGDVNESVLTINSLKYKSCKV
jgi:hypothetical protein